MAARPAARSRLPAVMALGLVPLLVHWAIAATGGAHLALSLNVEALFRVSVVTASALAHWAIYSGLLLTFGSTLRPGREALITAMARRLHGPLSDELTLYTRRATWAWCGFFAAQLTTSVTLFVFAPLVVWSFFVNVLDIPLVAAMFAVEYVYRLHRFRDPPRHSLAAIIDMIVDVSKRHGKPASSP